MKKRIKLTILLALFAACFAAVPAVASETEESKTVYTEAGFKYYKVDGAVTIKECYTAFSMTDDGVLTIPASLGQMPVATIESGAIKEKLKKLSAVEGGESKWFAVQTVRIPDTVTTLEKNAVPDLVTVIRNYNVESKAYTYIQNDDKEYSLNGLTYRNEEGLLTITGYGGTEKTLTIPSSIQNCKVVHIADNALKDCRVNRILIPDGVTVGENAVAGDYLVIYQYDTDHPLYFGQDPSETTAAPEETSKAGDTPAETTKAPDEIDVDYRDLTSPEATPEVVTVTEPEPETSAEEETSLEETEEASGEIAEGEPTDGEQAIVDPKKGREEKGLKPLDWVLIGIAAAVFLAASAAIATILIKRKKAK